MKNQYMAFDENGNFVLLYKSYFCMTPKEVLINLSYEGYDTKNLSVVAVNNENLIILKNTPDYDVVEC